MTYPFPFYRNFFDTYQIFVQSRRLADRVSVTVESVTLRFYCIYFPVSSANIKSVCKFEFVVCYDRGYDLVHKFAEDTMNRAVSEVKALSGYNVKGEVSSEIDTFVTGSRKGTYSICAHNISVVVLRYLIHYENFFWA